MSLYHVPNPTECGIVRLNKDGRVVAFVEKPAPNEVFSDLANAGVLVIEPEILNLIPAREICDFGSDVFPRLLDKDVPMYGWVLSEEVYLIDIGSHEKYAQAQREWPTSRAGTFFSRGTAS